MAEETKKTILIAGGAGFIGSHLISKYLNAGHRVIAIDNLQTTMKPKHIEKFFDNPRFTFKRHDIIEPLRFKEKIDWIFNCACAGSYTSYQYDPVHTVKTNTIGVINLLDLAREHGARIMQFSTSEIYGDPLESPQRETYLGNVNMLGPRACYDEGKRCAETLCMDYHREYGTDIKIIRIFNTYGPQMDPNDGRAITNFVMNALEGHPIEIYGDGSHTRSFQYIDDLIAGIDTMMRKENFLGPVNLGNPGEITMKELANAIIKKTSSTSACVYTKSATDDPKRRCPDIALAARELGWSPKISLTEGLDKTIAYFKTIERPDRKILVFATTYHPDLGPAENAVYELSQEMPDTEFHIITTKFRKGVSHFEKFGTDSIHRVGFGMKFDKYLLPIFGVWKAWQLHREHNYRFAWSVMASYGGISALLLKFISKDINFLLTLDPKELSGRSFLKSKILVPLYKIIFKNTDSVYVSDYVLEKNAKIIHPNMNISVMGDGSRAFMNRVRYTYIDLINKQERKLGRAK